MSQQRHAGRFIPEQEDEQACRRLEALLDVELPHVEDRLEAHAVLRDHLFGGLSDLLGIPL
jgi:hypothetical protein